MTKWQNWARTLGLSDSRSCVLVHCSLPSPFHSSPSPLTLCLPTSTPLPQVEGSIALLGKQSKDAKASLSRKSFHSSLLHLCSQEPPSPKVLTSMSSRALCSGSPGLVLASVSIWGL